MHFKCTKDALFEVLNGSICKYVVYVLDSSPF